MTEIPLLAVLWSCWVKQIVLV